MNVNDHGGRNPRIRTAIAGLLSVATVLAASLLLRVFPNSVTDKLESGVERLISVIVPAQAPTSPKPAPETPNRAGEANAASLTTSLQTLTTPSRSASRPQVLPDLNNAHSSMHGMPRWQAKNTAPRYLLIRLMATPKNHRSPPAVA